jgi:hypothetical protein
MTQYIGYCLLGTTVLFFGIAIFGARLRAKSDLKKGQEIDNYWKRMQVERLKKEIMQQYADSVIEKCLNQIESE